MIRRFAVAVALMLAACSPTTTPDDAAPFPDFTMHPHDLSTTDGAVDAGATDLASTPDLAAAPDLAVVADLAAPDDLSMPDLSMPDLSMPDLAMPDLAMPDLSGPDLLPPPIDLGPPPTVNGTIGSNEYGDHTDRHNRLDSGGTNWYATWDDTNLYLAVENANIDEAAVVYLDTNPLENTDAGTQTNADGNLQAQLYDGTNGALPFRADFVVYFKNGYHEFRAADGTGAWSAPTSNTLTVATSVATGSGIRELKIPWTTIRAAGRPTSLQLLGYVTSGSGFVYAPFPTNNPSGNIGTSATFSHFFAVTNANPDRGTAPFLVAF